MTEIAAHENFEKENYEKQLGRRLQIEIADLRESGYEVSVGETDDEVYDAPYKIDEMFSRLTMLGREYELRAQSSHRSLGAAALYERTKNVPVLSAMMPASAKSAYRRREDQLEDVRADLLFDETKMPWHQQRGKALALQTIVDAHELITVDGSAAGEGYYSTMSGRLSHDLIQTRFGDNDGSIAGMTLEEALVATSIRFYGKTEEKAVAHADVTLDHLDSFLHAPVTEDFKSIVQYCQDSLGIRSRQQEVRMAVANHVGDVLAHNPEKQEMHLMSIGCGTAQAILNVASDIRDRGVRPTIILLDQDPIALAAAKNLAEQMDLSDHIELHCERLFDRQGKPYNIEPIIAGRKLDVAEDTGLREYLPDAIYRNLSRTVWENLSDDGMMTTGNMNAARKQPEFLHGLMGWKPGVQMRKIADSFRLHEQSGVPQGNTSARVTRDGVYTLFYSYK